MTSNFYLRFNFLPVIAESWTTTNLLAPSPHLFLMPTHWSRILFEQWRCIGSLWWHTSLTLINNKFTGGFSASLCNLVGLSDLELSQNSFDSTLPSCIGQMSSLSLLRLSYNMFSGTIPQGFGILLLFSSPSACFSFFNLGTLGMLQELHLDHNSFTGALPYSLKTLSSLLLADFSYNKYV